MRYAIIVESPKKARTISQILHRLRVDGSVYATKGHIKDLPQHYIGVDLDTLEPTFHFLKHKKALLNRIAQGIKQEKPDLVLVATDPDREGEGIAFFVWTGLEEIDKRFFKDRLRRMRFYEVTDKGIKQALANLEEKYNENLVNAFFARRILDRLFGYIVSPKLAAVVGRRAVGTGRVQAPALRLIVEREREILAFTSITYYKVYLRVDIRLKDGRILHNRQMISKENITVPGEHVLAKLKQTLKALISNDCFELKTEHRITEIPPPKPLTTSDILSLANRRFGWSSQFTMRIAQALYELGYITYPRTDTRRISDAFAQQVRQYIKRKYGEQYVADKVAFSTPPLSQGAHEAIRVTNINRTVVPLPKPYQLLYNLIWIHSLMPFMKPEKRYVCIYRLTYTLPFAIVVLVDLDKGKREKRRTLVFEHEESCTLFPGFRIAEGGYNSCPEQYEQLCRVNCAIVKDFQIKEFQTKPPKRYTEATLIKKLESLGIGRPSTYPTIVPQLKKHRLIRTMNKGELAPTDDGFKVVDYLMEAYPQLVDYKLTAHIEKELDEIEEGKKDWKQVVKEFVYRVLRMTVGNKI